MFWCLRLEFEVAEDVVEADAVGVAEGDHAVIQLEHTPQHTVKHELEYPAAVTNAIRRQVRTAVSAGAPSGRTPRPAAGRSART